MTSVAELEARVAALEQLAGQPTASTLQPNVLTVNPDGTIGADFTGHVHAQGLDLDASAFTTPPAQDRIRWLRTDTGGLVADWHSYFTGPGGDSTLGGTAHAQGTTDSTVVALEVLDDLGTQRAELQVCQINRGEPPQNPGEIGGFTEIDVFTGSYSAMILGANGWSSFLQLASAQRLILHWGSASTAIPVGWSTQSVGFTAFPTAVTFAFAWPEGGIGASILSWNPSSFNNGSISVNINTNTAQTITFRAIAFGT